VFTGGPCGGKSSALEWVSKSLKEMGYVVYCVPEVPTILMSGGPRYPGLHPIKLPIFEKHLLQLQIAMEEAFRGIAQTEEHPVVIVQDRGLLDIKAYLPEDMWKSILSANNWKEEDFFKRYDAIIHLVTAADGAEKFYTTANNAARKETAEQAKLMDEKVKATWAPHARLSVVRNRGDFNLKLQDTLSAITTSLSLTSRQ